MKIISVLFVLSNLFALHNVLMAENDDATPTALFKAVFWDRFTSRSLVYAPWGNGEEANATIVTNRVGFSSPSRSFAYYGSSPVKFYIKNVGSSAENSTSAQENLKQIAEFSFEKKETTQRFLLIFLKQPSNKEFKVFPISISQQTVPFGSMVCYSQCREPLYIAYGSQKNVLAPGKSARFSYVENPDIEASKLRVFTRRDSKYEEMAMDYMALSKEKRAIVFLSPVRSRIRLKMYYFNREPMESALGYGSVPFIEKAKESEDENSTTILEPISQ